jgi:hypothetical protein
VVTVYALSFVVRQFGDFVCDLYCHARIHDRTAPRFGLLKRLHQTLKIADVYWSLYANPHHARARLADFRVRFNTVRPRRALVAKERGDALVPAEMYAGGHVIQIPRW